MARLAIYSNAIFQVVYLAIYELNRLAAVKLFRAKLQISDSGNEQTTCAARAACKNLVLLVVTSSDFGADISWRFPAVSEAGEAVLAVREREASTTPENH
jgi:hypothetical protein